MVDKESKALQIDWEDEIIKGTLISRDGAIVHPNLVQKTEAAAVAAPSDADSQVEDAKTSDGGD